MKQFLIALAMLLAACSSTGYDSGVDPALPDDHAHAVTSDASLQGALLRADPFDAAAPISVAEAAKAAKAADRGEMTGHVDPGVEAPAIYACPMHPEVTSTTPDKCPKCGMALVKRGTK